MSDSGSKSKQEGRVLASVPSVDLTELARTGKLDPVIGRDQEIGRLVNILTRRTKNNPALIGEAGVGKTAAIEGLAQRIADGDVPERLKGKRILSLDVTNLIAGTSMRGEFEERLSALVNEVVSAAGEIILFIDEMHLIMGAGAAGDAALDVANVLKPHLARGTVQCIGATTYSEYSKYIEKDPALARRFQKVVLAEPTVDDAVAILRGLREGFEAFHGIKIRDSALVAAVTLSHRYLPERRLPDKAIDLIDESASRRRTEIDSTPPKLRELSERIARLELERDSLSKDNDSASAKRLKVLQEDLQNLHSQSNDIRSKWRELVDSIHKRSELKSKLNVLKQEIDRAQRRIDFTTAAYLENTHLSKLQRELAEAEESAVPDAENQFAVPAEIRAEDIEILLSEWTGIPITRLGESDVARLLQMEAELKLRVVGQERATTVISDAIRIARAGINDPNRPLSSFLFLGPSGVGKTEVARVLADTIFGDPTAFIRLDMSEYFDRYTVSRLIGAAPGYIGYDEGGQLTEAVRRKPFACVLFDEIEKAHSDVYNVLLQILDEGRLTDSRGRVIDFKNTIIILTSNVGSELVIEGHSSESKVDGYSNDATRDGVSSDVKRAGVSNDVKRDGEVSKQCSEPEGGGIDSLPQDLRDMLLKRFRPELLNRIDELVVFSPLTNSALSSIVDLQIGLLNKRLAAKGPQLKLTDGAKLWLASKSYSPAFGARPLKRMLRKHIEVPLSRLLLNGASDSYEISVDVDNGALTFTNQNGQSDL
ncbi:MAG: AAA family ATPase [Candidatus Melainabacteria bacterium]|nr:AAA family ATPase [Candidatus Melainabacteria bacterium]